MRLVMTLRTKCVLHNFTYNKVYYYHAYLHKIKFCRWHFKQSSQNFFVTHYVVQTSYTEISFKRKNYIITIRMEKHCTQPAITKLFKRTKVSTSLHSRRQEGRSIQIGDNNIMVDNAWFLAKFYQTGQIIPQKIWLQAVLTL